MVPMSPPGHLLLYIFVLNLETLCGVGIHSSNSDLQRKRLCCENRRNVQTRALTMDFVYIRLLALRTWTVLQKFWESCWPLWVPQYHPLYCCPLSKRSATREGLPCQTEITVYVWATGRPCRQLEDGKELLSNQRHCPARDKLFWWWCGNLVAQSLSFFFYLLVKLFLFIWYGTGNTCASVSIRGPFVEVLPLNHMNLENELGSSGLARNEHLYLQSHLASPLWDSSEVYFFPLWAKRRWRDLGSRKRTFLLSCQLSLHLLCCPGAFGLYLSELRGPQFCLPRATCGQRLLSSARCCLVPFIWLA